VHGTAFAPPSWVQSLVGPAPTVVAKPLDGLTLRVTSAPHATFIRACVMGVGDLDALSFQYKTVQAYERIAAALRDCFAAHPVRFWNHIPHIRTAIGEGLDRYMAFNAGRFAAFHEWFGGAQAFDGAIATATGIGYCGRDLVIDILADERPGLHVQNPRQRRPFRYSCRFGPFPPCFARATVMVGASDLRRVLIGGTASIVDEASTHVGNLVAQTEETFGNLASLVRASRVAAGVSTSTGGGSDKGADKDVEALAAFESARVYYLHERDEDEVRCLVEHRWPHLSDIEFLRADICRPELLIEIEGVARLHADVGSS